MNLVSKLSIFFAELKRRKVYRVAVVYVVVGLGILGAAEVTLDPLGLEALRPYIVILVLLGFPIALVFAWAYEVKPEEPRETEPATAPAIETSESEQRKSIVVLPFDNMSPDPGDAYFSDGLTEEIITNLSYVRSLRVISRNSAMVLKGTQKDTRTIAAELDVQYVLEGSVRKAGDDLRITAQLINADSDEHLWAETYDGTMEDVFLIQEQTARSIVEALRLSLTPEEDQGLARRPFEDVRGYEWYLMARREMWTLTTDGLERARRHLENGIEVSGENLILLEGLADLHLTAYEGGIAANEETLREAEELANRISALQPDSANSHYLLGRIERFRGSIINAVEHWERALAIDPNHPGSLSWLFHSYALQTGRIEDAAPLMRKVFEQDPLNPLSWISIMWYHWMRGELEDTFSALGKLKAMMGGENEIVDLFTAYLLIWQDRRSEALVLIEGLIERDTPDLFTEWGLLLKHAFQGEGTEALGALSEETRIFLWNDPETVWLTASALAFASQKEEALDWLEHAVDRGWTNYPLFSEKDPLLESVRGDDRFKTLMERVKHEWEDSLAQRSAHA